MQRNATFHLKLHINFVYLWNSNQKIIYARLDVYIKST